MYYSQVLWIDDVTTNSQGQVLYRAGELVRINDKLENYGDTYWAAAEAFRPLTEEELAPIHPGVADKRIIVSLTHQVLSAFEGQQEVYFCRVSTGAKFNAAGEAVEKWSTPVGPHPIWRKSISFHMQGGSVESGWDTPGVPWTMLFIGEGIAVHSTFWHNDFGTARSHGCVNVAPDDSKWLFRWAEPYISVQEADQTIPMPGGTIVEVVEV
jgi:lipoprotein-anchoring transpeptidase ErfK/SrfK